ncbi:MAG: hypothetical protein AAF850_06320 [Pseudomonadota bacterium]
MRNHELLPFADDYVTRALVAAGMFSLAGFFVVSPLALFDDRQFNGVSLWWKPMKFWLSLGVQFLTYAVLAQLLSPESRSRLSLKVVTYVAVCFLAFENVYISIQAARARASHFNYDTPFEASMYSLMGAGALWFMLVAGFLGWMLARQKDGDSSGLKLGAVLGLLIGSIMTVAVAGFMSVYGSHYFNAPGTSDEGGLPIVGWSTTATDLRPAHFFAIHIIQGAPLAGWVGDQFGLGRALAVIATLIFVFATVVFFVLPILGRAPLGFLAAFS